MAVMASAQCFKTETFLAKCVAQADWGRKVIYVIDTDAKAHELVHERIDKNFNSSWYFARRVNKTNNVSQKLIGDGIMYFRGGQTPSKASSTAADTVVRDEKDLMKPAVSALYPKRLNAAPDPRLWDLGNPTHPETGIHDDFLNGDQRRWHVPCQRCGYDAPLDFKLYVKPDGRIECVKCGKPFDNWWPGYYKPHNPSAEYPSYHIHAIMNGLCDKIRRVQIWRDLESDDPLIEEAAVRMDLGLPYASSSVGLTFEDVKLSAHDGGNSPYAPGGLMVVDPGGVHDVQIYAKPVAGQPRRCVWSGTVKTFEELEKLENDSDVEFGIIDAMPELTTVETWCNRRKGKWKRVFYNMDDEAGFRWQISTKLPHVINANRSLLADWLVAQIRKQFIRFPGTLAKYKKSRLTEHLLAPRRRLERNEKTGKIKVRWLEEGNKADHQFHCGIYGLIGWQHFFERKNQGGSKRGSGSY